MTNAASHRIRYIVLSACASLLLLKAASAAENKVTIQDPRPVAKAVEYLNNKYGWQVTYEDPPYSNINDITDVTGLISHEPVAERILIPKGDYLLLSLPTEKPSAADEINNIVKAYNARRMGRMFTVVQDANTVHVIPNEIRGESGKIEKVKPVLSYAVNIPPEKRTAFALLSRICK